VNRPGAVQGATATRKPGTGSKTPAIPARLARLDWVAIERSLQERGHAVTPPVLTPGECAALVRLYAEPERFRSRVNMASHRFGLGEYQYFREPLPPLVQALRVNAYPRLAEIANRWMADLRSPVRYPGTLAALRAHCRRHGQTRPTPLLLRYEEGGYNCLHQDLYGEVAFPLQMTFLLSRPGVDFRGGEFLLVEQRPRQQSIGTAVTLGQGGMVIFATRERPVAGARGHYRAVLRHGLSRLVSGTRYALGIIFHDAA
jgi:hypothetical protein